MSSILIYLIIVAIAILLFEAGALGDTVYSEKIVTFAQAIASAEGFGIPGAIPTQAHNPGDLVLSDANSPLGKLGEGITIFPDDQTGWNHLYQQLQYIVNGQSSVYNLDMTISDMAYSYTATQQDSWAENVASKLGVTRDTTLRSVLT